MTTEPQQNTDDELTGGFIADPTAALPLVQSGCCGEPADSAGLVPGGQSGGCCGEPAGES
ncbi:hypothetical protein ACFYW8_25795 [Streptomyces sp. NPDC002742]|uniref:hypothetical protein n=1 Tax=Streptomyces sp. NPDC002742 TaxID=3364663 RepID=UPI0036B7126A